MSIKIYPRFGVYSAVFVLASLTAEARCPFEPGSDIEKQYYCAGYNDGYEAGQGSATGSTTKALPLSIIQSFPQSQTSSEIPEGMVSIYVPGDWKERLSLGATDWAQVTEQSQLSSPRVIVPGNTEEPNSWALVDSAPITEWAKANDQNLEFQQSIEGLLSKMPESDGGYTLLLSPELQEE